MPPLFRQTGNLGCIFAAADGGLSRPFVEGSSEVYLEFCAGPSTITNVGLLASGGFCGCPGPALLYFSLKGATLARNIS
jgi:hypothetical protein